MSEALLAAGCCGDNQPCTPAPGTQGPPGPQGPEGPTGPAGADGKNAYDTLAAGFTMPAEGATVTIQLTQGTAWLVPDEAAVTGHILVIQFAGYFEVASITDATHAVVKNLADTPGNLYLGNAAPGTSIPTLSLVCSGGLQGPPGDAAAAGAPTTASYITRVPEADLTNEFPMSGLATGLVKNTTATGVPIIAADGTDYLSPTTGIPIGRVGVADTKLPPVNDASGLTSGDAVFATASGLETKPAADARAALGVAGSAPYVLVLYKENFGVNGAALNNTPTLVPLNQILWDTGSIATLPGSNAIRLPAGSYRYNYVCRPSGDPQWGRAWLYSLTDAGMIGATVSQTTHFASTNGGNCPGVGRIVLTQTTDIQFFAQAGAAASLGEAASLTVGGVPQEEIYAWIEFWQE